MAASEGRQYSVNVATNTVQARGGIVAKANGRWEAVTLALFLSANRRPVSLARLQEELTSRGQRAPLDRKGRQRLIHAIQAMVARVADQEPNAKRVRYLPRQLTTGPWSFHPLPTETWIVEGDSVDSGLIGSTLEAKIGSNSGNPSIVADTESGQTESGSLRAVQLLLRADALLASSQLCEAAEVVRMAIDSRDISIEFMLLCRIRLARILGFTGRYDEAEELALDVARQAELHRIADTGLTNLARHVANRSAFMRNPGEAFGLRIPDSMPIVHARADARVMAESDNLHGLILRRQAIRSASANHPGALRLLDEAWRKLCSAMYWALSQRDHWTCQSIAVNMGLVQASRQDYGVQEAAVLAFHCYKLAMQIRADFMVEEESAWDRIAIADLWLNNPDLRSRFEGPLAHDHASYSDVAAYAQALTFAKRLTDPRQTALCAINLWRFGAEVQGPHAGATTCRNALTELKKLLIGRDELRATLFADAPETMKRILEADR